MNIIQLYRRKKMNDLTIRFNNKDYIARYNKQTEEYEIELEAPKTGRNI